MSCFVQIKMLFCQFLSFKHHKLEDLCAVAKEKRATIDKTKGPFTNTCKGGLMQKNFRAPFWTANFFQGPPFFPQGK